MDYDGEIEEVEYTHELVEEVGEESYVVEGCDDDVQLGLTEEVYHEDAEDMEMEVVEEVGELDPQPCEAEADVDPVVEEEKDIHVECDIEETVEQSTVPVRQTVGKSKGPKGGKDKGAKGKGKAKDSKGKGKDNGQGKGKSDADNPFFRGVIYTAGVKTGNMLIRCWYATEKFGQEVMIPAKLNPMGAVVGDRVQFEVVQGREGGRPLAVNVSILGHVDKIQEVRPQVGTDISADIKRQVLYYLSDENLAKDQFFREIMASNDGWIDLASIVGCARMKKMGATAQSVIDSLRDCSEVEFQEEPAGSEAIRRTTPFEMLDQQPAPVALGSPREVAPPAFTPQPAPTGDDVFFVGKVKSGAGWKLFIECPALKDRWYGKDVFFHPDQKPKGVEDGMSVTFTFPCDHDSDKPPQASFLARVVVDSTDGQENQSANNWNGTSVGKGPARRHYFKGEGKGAGKKGGKQFGKHSKGGVGKAHGVQPTIYKRTSTPQ